MRNHLVKLFILAFCLALSSQSGISAEVREKRLYIYDWDGTLFKSPVPNEERWQKQVGNLKSAVEQGGAGWFQFLATLVNIEDSVKRNPAYWFNEKLVSEILKLKDDPDAITALLTNRDTRFADITKSYLGEMKLELDHYYFSAAQSLDEKDTAIEFKKGVMRKLIEQYSATKIFVYEDRPGHAEKFRSFLTGLKTEFEKEGKVLAYEVVDVKPLEEHLPEAEELKLVEKLLNANQPTWRINDNKKGLVIPKTIKQPKPEVEKKFNVASLFSAELGLTKAELQRAIGQLIRQINNLKIAQSEENKDAISALIPGIVKEIKETPINNNTAKKSNENNKNKNAKK